MAAKTRAPTFDVFVAKLPSDANEKNVGKLFTPYGEIGGIIVKESPKVQGPYNKYAFVKYLCEPDADRACQELNNMKLQGSDIVVKRADKDKPKRNPGDNQGRRNFKSADTDSTDGTATTPVYQQHSGGGEEREESSSSHTGFLNSRTVTIKPQLSIGQKETVMITHVESPITLWLQVVNDENTKKIFNITEQLATLCPAASNVSGAPEPSKVYACLFTEDNMWYRCQVKQNLGTDKFKIQYIDYGNTEEVSLSSLVEIPPSLANMKGLAAKIVLHNTRAKDLSDKQGIQCLKTLTDNQMAQLSRTRMLTDGTGHYGQVFVNGQSVADAMIQAGYAQIRPAMGKTGSAPGQQHGRGPGHMDGMEPPGPSMMGATMFGGGGKPMHPLQQQQQQPPWERNTVSPLGGPPNMGYQMPPVSHHDMGKEKELQTELTRKLRELEKIRNEKDAANMQVEYMRTKIKALQDEFSASTAKLKEDTLSKRIQTVTHLATRVRHLRSQFPTKPSTPCLLEEAIKLCSDTDRVDNTKCTTLAEVGSSLARYKASQDEISKCKEQCEQQELIKARDVARRELYDNLKLSLAELEKLPLETRSQQVQDVRSKLGNIYSEYLQFQIHDCPSIENLAPGFLIWKNKKDCEFTDMRTATDFCEGAIQTALSHVKLRLSVDGETAAAKLSEVDTDDLLKTYAHALQREINVSDMVRSKDSNLLATVIAAVRRELQTESSMLENFRVLQQEFISRRDVIEPWLDEKPTFTELQENRKQLRSFKSKLRHILADKQDLEESGDEGELDTVKEEETNIRSKLQAALAQSDSLLNEVASLADSNFPELIVQYPDLGIDNYLQYKGLVKSNRDIDHYSLRSGFRQGVHLSTFDGQPVIIQEFHIGGGEHCSKEDFIQQIVNYNTDSSTIQAVFFSKNERQAYVQSEWLEGKLVTIEDQKTTWSPRDLQHVCCQVCEHVHQLHTRKCIHGEITPFNILLREDNSVTVMYPDFSKTKQERMSKRYSTESGLVFQSPELQYSSPDVLGAAADVYNLVLLIFWLHSPDVKSIMGKNGRPMTKLPDMDPSLQQLFDRVLSGKTATNISTEQILQLNYFSRTLPDVITPVTPPLLAMTPEIEVTQQPIKTSNTMTNQDMEIGVFRPEDFVSAPIPEPMPSVDTDDSWTTQGTSSASSGSRVESPSDTTFATGDQSDISQTESLKTVIEADGHSGEAIAVSGNTFEVGSDTLSSGMSEMVKTQTPDVTLDVFSQATNDDYLATQTEVTKDSTVNDGVNGNNEVVEESTDIPLEDSTATNEGDSDDLAVKSGDPQVINEKGAACETSETQENDLKSLLKNSKKFLTNGDALRPKSPLEAAVELTKRNNLL